MINTLGSGIQTVGNVKNLIEENTIFSMYDSDIMEDELRHDNVTIQAVYLSFHELAQIMAADEITTAYGKRPKLEKNVNLWGSKEADIVLGKEVWEIKPDYYTSTPFQKALNKYCIDGYFRGAKIDAVKNFPCSSCRN